MQEPTLCIVENTTYTAPPISPQKPIVRKIRLSFGLKQALSLGPKSHCISVWAGIGPSFGLKIGLWCRERERETDRQTERRGGGGGRDRQKEREREGGGEGETGRQKERNTERERKIQTDRQTDRQKHRDIHTYRQTETQRETYCKRQRQRQRGGERERERQIQRETERQKKDSIGTPTSVLSGVSKGQVRLVESQGQEEGLVVRGPVAKKGNSEVGVLLVRQFAAAARNLFRLQGTASVVVQLAVRSRTYLTQQCTFAFSLLYCYSYKDDKVVQERKKNVY